MLSVGKKSLILTITKIITLLVSLIVSMLLSRYATLEEYGTYSQLLIAVNLFTSIFMLGLPNSTNYFLVKYTLLYFTDFCLYEYFLPISN